MGEHERLLLADDSSLTLDSLQRVVAIGGHEVAALAHSVDEVIAAVDNPQTKFSLAIVDGKMPEEGDGERAAKYIKEKRPEVKVMQCSTRLGDWGDIRIEKGFSMREMLDAIRRV